MFDPLKQKKQGDNAKENNEKQENQQPAERKQPKHKRDWLAAYKTRSFRIGSYSLAATALVLAIVIVLNLLVSALPSKWTQIDISSNQLYSISQQTEELLSALDEPVEVYWICQSGSENSTLESLLNKYAGMSNKLSVSKKDPNVNPTFVQQYVSGSVYNNSLIVLCGERSRYVAYDEIFEYDYSNYYSTGSYSINFAGEAALSSAISYVTSENLPKLYTLSGHGEQQLSNSFSDAIEKQNVQVESLSLLSMDAVPEDADCLLIYAPSTDISTQELELLQSYLEQGGSLYYISQPAEEAEQYANLEALLSNYGMSSVEGIVVEGSPSNYSVQGPIYLIPSLKSHGITSPLISGNYYVMAPIAHGISIASDLPDGVSVSSLLSTSSSAYSKLDGYSLTTFEKEEADLDGPFTLAAAAEDENSGAQLVWLASSYLLDDSVNQQVSGGNQDLFLNGLAWMCELEDSISIHSKSMDYNYLTIDNGTASLLSVLFVAVIPLLYLSVGLVRSWKRRRR